MSLLEVININSGVQLPVLLPSSQMCSNIKVRLAYWSTELEYILFSFSD